MNNRIEFTKFLFHTLNQYEYVLLKHIEDSIENVRVSSDLDILVRSQNVSAIVTQLKSHKTVAKWTESHKASMVQYFIYFEDTTFLQVDFLYKFIRTNTVYLDTETIFEKRVQDNEGIYVTDINELFEHVVLFNFLNFAGLPKKYIPYFNTKAIHTKNSFLTYFNEKYGTQYNRTDQFKKFDPELRAKIIAKTNKLSQNKGLNQLKNNWAYFTDRLQAMKKDKGITITFTGVDGAGKTTILTETNRILTEKYKQKVVMLRHRPQLLPILSSIKHGKAEAEKIAAKTLPRTGGNKSSIGSLLRFLYYYMDYIVGQFYIYFKYNRKGITVLYDRYYFDFIVDHRRSNININPAIPRFLYNFVFKPELNIFLYASPEVILKRKKELPSNEIVELTKKYKGLFDELDGKGKNRYIPIENIILEETLDTIFKAYQEVK